LPILAPYSPLDLMCSVIFFFVVVLLGLH